MKKQIFLGIDTSNYTTSAALCDADGNILLNAKYPLPVKEGERGLRQSDAVFHHVKNLPAAAEEVGKTLEENPESVLTAIGCSQTPRDSEGSYMPCFLAGVAAASMTARTQAVPLYTFSHQAGHIMAAMQSVCRNYGLDRAKFLTERFIAFHVSGGTTDVLLCEPDADRIFQITQIGGTHDINGGQAIDRTGVRMGLAFPCGPAMDRAALTYTGRLAKPRLSVEGTWCNLSGLENKAGQLFDKTGDVAETSAYTLDFIAKTLEQITLHAREAWGEVPVIYAGGVMSSAYIRRTLEKHGYFADAVYSADNAAGVALLAAEQDRRQKN